MVVPFCLDGLKKTNIDLGYSTNIGWSLFSVTRSFVFKLESMEAVFRIP
jgi:hypothetical protein